MNKFSETSEGSNKTEPSTYVFLYVTFPSKDSAQNIITALLQARLIACANVFPPISSYYMWKGSLEHEQEVSAILKTKSDFFNQIEDHITTHHPYDTPCIVEIPIHQISAPFAGWLDKKLKER